MNQAAVKSWKDKLDEACQVPSGKFIYEDYYAKDRGDQLQKTGAAVEDPEVDAKIKSNIDMALAKGKMAAVAYQPSFMLKNPVKGTMHWSSVVGRAKSPNGTCMYMIRNSYGADCSAYKDPNNCRSGYIWVPQKDLIKNSSSVTSIR